MKGTADTLRELVAAASDPEVRQTLAESLLAVTIENAVSEARANGLDWQAVQRTTAVATTRAILASEGWVK